MLARLKRFDRLIAESEARIAEQRALIARAEAKGQSTTVAEHALATFEDVLAEYRRARDTTEKLRRVLAEAPRTPRAYRPRYPS